MIEAIAAHLGVDALEVRRANLVGLLPVRLARVVARIEPYGLAILIALLVTGVLGRFVSPFILAGLQLLPGSEVVIRFFFS